MESSIMSRFFPPSGPILPQHERRDSNPTPVSPRIMSSESSSSPARSQRSSTAMKPSLQPAPLSASIVHHDDPFLPVDRAAKALERNIQSFLDAQSEGLLAGLGSGGQDNLSSNGSLTPTPSASTPRSAAGPRTLPLRQPRKKRVTLAGARRGLARSMKEFVLLKEEELKVLNEQAGRREEAIQKVTVFVDKKAGLSHQIAKINNAKGAQQASRIKAEAESLESEIQRLEDELAEKKARHRLLMAQAVQRESSVQSKLSSFETSMKMLDLEIKTFLKQPPIDQSLQTGGHGGESVRDFYALNPKRRTLDMAKEHWQEEEAMLRQRKEDVGAEIAALKQGSEIWRGIVTEITDFEKWLQKTTSELSRTQSDAPDDMSSVLTRIGGLIEMLTQRLQQAEDEGWNLLVCCIGAELEAYREGQALLSRTLGMVQENGEAEPSGAPGSELVQYGGENGDGRALRGSNESLNATLLAMEGTMEESRPQQTPPAAPGGDSRSESEDEGPGFDFLISHD